MDAGSAEGGPCPSRRVSRAAVQGRTEGALRSFNSWLTCQGDDKGMLTKLATVVAGEMSFFDVVTSRQIKRSPFISRMWTWWVRWSSSAPVRRSAPNTSFHSSKGRLVVTRMEPCSQRWLKTSKPSSSTARRFRRNRFLRRLSSRISSRASSGPLYLVFTGGTPKRGHPAGVLRQHGPGWKQPCLRPRLEIPPCRSSAGGWKTRFISTRQDGILLPIPARGAAG